MRYLNRYGCGFIIVCAIIFLFNFLQLKSYDSTADTSNLNDNIEELKQRIKTLENVIEHKENDLENLKDSLETNLRFYSNFNENFKFGQQHQASSNTSLNELNTALSYDIHFPFIIDILPHLNGRLANIQTKMKVTKNRFAKIVIGIPTIKREKTSYLLETVKSLFDSMSEAEKNNVLVVILIAELQDVDFIQRTVESLTKLFSVYLDNGLLDIIVPPTEYYPNLDNLAHENIGQNIYGDPFERIKWRTKQNYDFAYLMTYALRRGVYYLQIEDDVVSKLGCVSTIIEFINSQKSNRWLILEFTQLGFIGKLFKTKDLPLFVNFFLMFSTDKPVDWLSDSVFNVRACDPERGAVTCERSKIELKARYKPSLFQHVGLQSSLKGKTQKLKDKDYGKQQLIVIKTHSNPRASIVTSLKTYMKYTIESVYLGLNYFWSMSPAINDQIQFQFEKPILLKSYYIRSGSPEHPDDKLTNCTVEIRTVNAVQLPSNTKYAHTKDNFIIISHFTSDIGVLDGLIDSELFGQISHFRIRISAPSQNWILISDIDFSNYVQ